MEGRKGVLWYLLNGAMELSCFFAWATFSAIATMHGPFPFLETIAAFALAALLTRISMGKGWRIVHILGLQVLGFICAALTILHRLYYDAYPLLGYPWLARFFEGPRGALEWLVLLINLFLIILLWTDGVALTRRPRAYYAACGRFDLGLALFLALFLIKLTVLVRGEIRIDDTVSLLFVFPFFLFGLLSIGTARIRSSAEKDFLPGYQGMGVIIGFAVIVLLGAAGLVLFCLPGLTAAAELGYRGLKIAGAPLGYVFLSIVRFMYIPRGMRPEAPAEPLKGIDWGGSLKPGTHGWWVDLLEKILGYGLWGLMLLVLTVLGTIALLYLLKWLLSRSSVRERDKGPRESISWWLVRLWSILVSSYEQALHTIRGYKKASELYGALLCWGRRTGFPRAQSETPSEFGARLDGRFPRLKPQIEEIISAFNREVYGEIVLSGAQLASARSAWRHLHSPLLWPLRLRSWVLKPTGERRET